MIMKGIFVELNSFFKIILKIGRNNRTLLLSAIYWCRNPRRQVQSITLAGFFIVWDTSIIGVSDGVSDSTDVPAIYLI